ncbi:4-hydroxythreonine-4-phosphate dehydrogenase PdxA [Tropicimonas sp. IMCC6043]|uniref:4-hydroxythreonine-4-phosphate dehydrogenase PdxA n=1 Tax=Tropicimonas sp. IMCC6043 TaxID=2510645 RepID=UPI00101CFE0A|nr:4-hydroxythreonine-4-phosphate dehydrogenase PdxA [Tropicimonas sp. IMCC6043]RYH11217.1 4-hydroxythreonine-4-phosphate dehydrogenase PdxA [Tropicimonas sp. IMCC6043]
MSAATGAAALPPVMSCGEPAGVGPEIAARAWDRLRDSLPFAWIGDPAHLPQGTPLELVDSPADAATVAATALPVLAHPFAAPAVPGQPDLANAAGVVEVIARAVGLVQAGQASAVVTAPINKKVLQDGAGFAYPGHTEYLAALGGVDRVVMMLACEALKVVPATIHIALSEVPAALTPELLRDSIRITAASLVRDFGVAAPRLAVAGLNPHAGEGGAMGREELDWIAPLLEELRAEGIALAGPLPADTMFHAEARARYDAAICAYHDQALIPIKTLDFARGVNVTLGLPFIRTSPDHGTAFDIAGRGVADIRSTVEALRMAERMAARRAAA